LIASDFSMSHLTQKLIFIVLLVLSGGLFVAAAQTAPVPMNGQLSFIAQVDNVSQLFVVDTEEKVIRQVTTGVNSIESVSWSADGEQVAIGNAIEDVTLLDIADNTEIPVPNSRFLVNLDWSSDGQFLIGVDNSIITYVDIASDVRTSVPLSQFPPGYFAEQPTWSTDGSQILFSSSGVNPVPFALDGLPNTDLYVVNRDGTELAMLSGLNGGQFGGLGWLSDREVIFSATLVRDARLIRGVFKYDLQTESLTLLTDPEVASRSPVIAPDRTKIAYIEGATRIMVMQLDSLETEFIVDFGRAIRGLKWQPRLISDVTPTPTACADC